MLRTIKFAKTINWQSYNICFLWQNSRNEFTDKFYSLPVFCFN